MADHTGAVERERLRQCRENDARTEHVTLMDAWEREAAADREFLLRYTARILAALDAAEARAEKAEADAASLRCEYEGQSEHRPDGDGTDRLVMAIHGRKARARDYIGGASAHMLHEGADEIIRLRAALARAEGRRAKLCPKCEGRRIYCHRHDSPVRGGCSDSDIRPCPCGSGAVLVEDGAPKDEFGHTPLYREATQGGSSVALGGVPHPERPTQFFGRRRICTGMGSMPTGPLRLKDDVPSEEPQCGACGGHGWQFALPGEAQWHGPADPISHSVPNRADLDESNRYITRDCPGCGAKEPTK